MIQQGKCSVSGTLRGVSLQSLRQAHENRVAFSVGREGVDLLEPVLSDGETVLWSGTADSGLLSRCALKMLFLTILLGPLVSTGMRFDVGDLGFLFFVMLLLMLVFFFVHRGRLYAVTEKRLITLSPRLSGYKEYSYPLDSIRFVRRDHVFGVVMVGCDSPRSCQAMIGVADLEKAEGVLKRAAGI